MSNQPFNLSRAIKTASRVPLESLAPELAKAAQEVYDEWSQDAEGIDVELGAGGICQDIAEKMAGVLSSRGFDCSTVSSQVGEQHVWVVCRTKDGVYSVDINPSVYETGGGYSWKKIEGVRFEPRHVYFDRISNNPKEFEALTADASATQEMRTASTNPCTVDQVEINWHISGDMAVIDMFRVPKECRHQGLGTAAYSVWEAKLPARIKRVWLQSADTGEGNPHEFWESLGFDYRHKDFEDGEPAVSDPSYEDYWAMEKVRPQTRQAATQKPVQPRLFDVPATPQPQKPLVQTKWLNKPKKRKPHDPRQMPLQPRPEPTGRFEDGDIEEGLNIMYPTVSDSMEKYIFDNDPKGIAEALEDPAYPEYYADLQLLLHRVFGETITVARKPGYGGDGRGVGEYVSVSVLSTWSGNRYTIDPKQVVLAGHEAEGELVVKRDALVPVAPKVKPEEAPRTPGRIPLRYQQPIGSNFFKHRPPGYMLTEWACCDQAVPADDNTGRLNCHIHGFTEPPKTAAGENWYRQAAAQQWVTDESGKPLVVYHGSRSPMVENFDMGRDGTGAVSLGHKNGGIFFTSSPDNAEFYADPRELPRDINPDSLETYGSEQDGYFYLLTDEQFAGEDGNPDWRNNFDQYRAIINDGPYESEEKALAAGQVAVRKYNASLKRGENMFVRGYYLKMVKPFIGDDSKSPGAWIPEAQKGGCDGVIVRGVIDGYCRSDIYIVFSPGQAKPAPIKYQLKAAAIQAIPATNWYRLASAFESDGSCWMSPDCKVVNCGEEPHQWIARHILDKNYTHIIQMPSNKNFSIELEQLGWLRISDTGDTLSIEGPTMTDAQKMAIIEEAKWLDRKVEWEPAEGKLVTLLEREASASSNWYRLANEEVFQPCCDCGMSTMSQFYRAKDEVWVQAMGAKPIGKFFSPKGLFLCVICLEKRLGRKLNRNDFDDIYMNFGAEMQKHKRLRLLDRLQRSAGMYDQDNTEAVIRNRPAVREESIRAAKSQGVQVTPSGDVVLFHGTSPRNAKLIERSGKLHMGTYFATDYQTAERYAYQATSSGEPVVLTVTIDPSAVFPGNYWTLNEEVILGDDGTYRPANSNPISTTAAAKPLPDQDLEKNIPGSTFVERWDETVKGRALVEVVKNPSMADIARISNLQEYAKDYIGAIVTSNNSYAFRRDLEFHKNVANQLHLSNYVGILLARDSTSAQVTDATSENLKGQRIVVDMIRKQFPTVKEVSFYNESIAGKWRGRRTASADVTCQNCGHIFDYSATPEVSMGAVKCPTCGVNLNQNGTNLDAIQLLRMYLAEVVGLRAEMDRMVSESWQEGWQDAVQCLQQARTMLGDIGLPLDEVIDNGIDWLEGDAVVAELIQTHQM